MILRHLTPFFKFLVFFWKILAPATQSPSQRSRTPMSVLMKAGGMNRVESDYWVLTESKTSSAHVWLQTMQTKHWSSSHKLLYLPSPNNNYITKSVPKTTRCLQKLCLRIFENIQYSFFSEVSKRSKYGSYLYFLSFRKPCRNANLLFIVFHFRVI